MQERLHIDELKRVERSVNTLLKSWQKLNKNHLQLEAKYAALCEELAQIKAGHQQEIAQMAQKYRDAEQASEQALSEAVAQAQQTWQEKYDQSCANYDQQLHSLQQTHQAALDELRQQMTNNETALRAELAQVSKVKDALRNRVLGVEV